MTKGIWARFGRDERGVSVVEFALLMPVMLALLLGAVTVFDLFRTAQSAEKATFTVGDMLSRQTAPITEAQLKTMVTFVANTVDYEGEARIRVSSISNTAGKLVTEWTKTVGNTAVTIPAMSFSDIPTMAAGDSVILTEVYVPHRAFVAIVGLDDIVYVNRAVHRPRFVGKIAYK